MYLRAWFALLLSIFLTSGGAAPSGLPPGLSLSSFLSLNLVTQINVFISLETLSDNIATTNFDLKNTLILPLIINEISSNAGVNNTVFATFSHTFNPPLVINPGETVNSGNITNVNLPQGALNSLQIIPLGILNLDSNVVAFGFVPIDGLTQDNVPTSYTLALS